MSILADVLSRTTDKSIYFKQMLQLSNNMTLDTVGNTIANRIGLNIYNGPWLAGGSVRKCFGNESIGYSDWDIFFKNKQQFDEVSNILKNIKECYVIFESKNAVTYHINDYSDNNILTTPIKIQLICRKFFDSWEDLVSDFDFTICQFVTDGHMIKMGQTTYLDNVDKVLKLTSPDMHLRSGFMARVIKYITYGYKPSRELLELIDTNFDKIDFSTKVDEYEF